MSALARTLFRRCGEIVNRVDSHARTIMPIVFWRAGFLHGNRYSVISNFGRMSVRTIESEASPQIRGSGREYRATREQQTVLRSSKRSDMKKLKSILLSKRFVNGDEEVVAKALQLLISLKDTHTTREFFRSSIDVARGEGRGDIWLRGRMLTLALKALMMSHCIPEALQLMQSAVEAMPSEINDIHVSVLLSSLRGVPEAVEALDLARSLGISLSLLYLSPLSSPLSTQICEYKEI